MRPGPGLVVMALAFISGARRGSTSTSTSSKILVKSFSTSSTASSSPLLLTTTLPPTTTSSSTSKSKSVPTDTKSIILPFIDTFFHIPPTPIITTATTTTTTTTLNRVLSGNGDGDYSGGGGVGRKRIRRRRTRKSSKYKRDSKLKTTEFVVQYEPEYSRRDIYKLPTLVLPSHLQKQQQENYYTNTKTKTQQYTPLIDYKSTIRRKRGIKQDSTTGKVETQKRSFASLSSASLSSATLSLSSSSSSSADEINNSVGSVISSLNKITNNNNIKDDRGGGSNIAEEVDEEIEDSAEGLIIHYPTQQSTDSSISFDEDEDILALVAKDNLISEESFDRLTKLTENRKINYINEEDDDYSEAAVSEQLDSLTSSRSSISSKSSSSSSQDSEGVISDNRRKKTVTVIDSDLIKVAVLPQNNLIDGNSRRAQLNENEHHIAYVSKLLANKNDLVAHAHNDNKPSVKALSLVQKTTELSDKSLILEVPKRSIIESASPLTRLNPWISACDLAQPGVAPDLQGQCSASTLPVAWVDEGPGPPTCPESCAQKRRKTRSTVNINLNNYNYYNKFNENNNNDKNNKLTNIKLKNKNFLDHNKYKNKNNNNNNNFNNNNNNIKYENIINIDKNNNYNKDEHEENLKFMSLKVRRNVADDTKVASKQSTITTTTTTASETTTASKSTMTTTTTPRTSPTAATKTSAAATSKATTTAAKTTTTTINRTAEIEKSLSSTTQEVEVTKMFATPAETASTGIAEKSLNNNNNNKNYNNNNNNHHHMNYENVQPQNVANVTTILALNKKRNEYEMNDKNNSDKDVVNNKMHHHQQQQLELQEQQQQQQEEEYQKFNIKMNENIGELKYSYLLQADEHSHSKNSNNNNNNNNKYSKQQQQQQQQQQNKGSSSIANKLAIQKFLVKEEIENTPKARKKYNDQNRANIMGDEEEMHKIDENYIDDDDDKQQCLDYLGDSEETSPLHLCSIKSPGQLVARLRELRLRHCCERNVFSTLHTIALNATLSGGVDCVRILMDIIDLDALATRITCEYAEILFRFDCGQVYSLKHQCHDCKEAYRRWVCSTLVPYFAEPSDVIMPIFSHSNSNNKNSKTTKNNNNNNDDVERNRNTTSTTTTTAKADEKLHKNTNKNIINGISNDSTMSSGNNIKNKRRNKRGTNSCTKPTVKTVLDNLLVYYMINKSSLHFNNDEDDNFQQQQQQQEQFLHTNNSISTANIMDPCISDDPVILKINKRTKRSVQFRKRKRIRPCLKVCQTVEQMCPYLLPADRAPAMPTQYAGEPTFLCLDLNIPEVEEQNLRSINGEKDCCYTYCGNVESGICTHCPSFAKSVQNPPTSMDVTNATRRLHNITITPSNQAPNDNTHSANNGNSRTTRISIALNNDSETTAVNNQRIMESLPYYAYYDGIFYYDDDTRDMPLQALSGDCDAVPSVTSRCTVPYYVSSAQAQQTSKNHNYMLLWVSMLLCFFSSYQAALPRRSNCQKIMPFERKSHITREIDYEIMPEKNYKFSKKFRNTKITIIIIFYNKYESTIHNNIKTTKAVLSLINIIILNVNKPPPPPTISLSPIKSLFMYRFKNNQVLKPQEQPKTYAILKNYDIYGDAKILISTYHKTEHNAKKQKKKKKQKKPEQHFCRTNNVKTFRVGEEKNIIKTTITILIQTSTYLVYKKIYKNNLNTKNSNNNKNNYKNQYSNSIIKNYESKNKKNYNNNQKLKQIFQLFYYYNFNINDWWRRWWNRAPAVNL